MAAERIRKNAEIDSAEDYQDQEIHVDVMELFYRLLEKAWLIALVGFAAAIIAGLYTSLFVEETYTATTKLYVIGEDTAIDLTQLNFGDKLADDYVQVFRNRDVYAKVSETLLEDYGYKLPGYETVQKYLNVTQLSNTRILSISYTCGSAEEAKLVVEVYADKAIGFISARMGAQVPPTVFEEPYASGRPAGPNLMRNVILAMIAGAVLMVAILVCQFVVDDRIRTAEQLQNHLNLPTLGMMPVQKAEARNIRRKGEKA